MSKNTTTTEQAKFYYVSTVDHRFFPPAFKALSADGQLRPRALKKKFETHEEARKAAETLAAREIPGTEVRVIKYVSDRGPLEIVDLWEF